MKKAIVLLMILAILLMILPAEAKIDAEQFEPDEQYKVYGYELIEIVEYINELEFENELLGERLEIERLAHDEAISRANDVIEKKDQQIKALEDYNSILKRKQYIDYVLYFTAGFGVGSLF